MTAMNSATRMKKTLPGLANFYSGGQWISPGGGLPTAAMLGRRIIQIICKPRGASRQLSHELALATQGSAGTYRSPFPPSRRLGGRALTQRMGPGRGSFA
jgi:hypothetical protein